jgi:tRNA pseudouridine13 synthase
MSDERPSPLIPLIPPIATADLPGTGGGIGAEPEDFRVDEVPLYSPSGEGEHLYVRLEKRRLTTRDAVRMLADATGVPASEMGTAGMKDKHAVTTQWVSLPARRAKPVGEWVLPEGLRVVESARHGNKLRTGHLRGNRFRIHITGVEPGALGRARRVIERLREQGLPNYYGAQRFGHGGNNLADALAWLAGECGRGARRRVPPFERKLFASVVQSEVFNRYVTARLAEDLSLPLAGEVVRLEGSGAMFAVEDVEKETARWVARDIHPTGPMVGPKMKPASGRPLQLELAAAASLGLDDAMSRELARFADGTRRDVFVRLPDVKVEAAPSPAGSDAAGPRGGDPEIRPEGLILEFFLPSGSYATELVRELTREPFFRYSPEP